MLDHTAEFSFTAAGGTPPYAFVIAVGHLQEGLVLNANGTVTGTLTSDAAAYVEIEAIDGKQFSGLRAFWFNPFTIFLPTISRK